MAAIPPVTPANAGPGWAANGGQLPVLGSWVFKDAKRPITADILKRLNLDALATTAGFANAWGKVGNGTEGSPRQPEVALMLG